VHPTQKPLGILDPLIRYSVPVDGIVIDPFIGSLSTGIAAAQAGRQWAGCEINPECAAMHAQRLAQPGLEFA
jgi:site-specific DNA-methyltransferase (adenine-specific)